MITDLKIQKKNPERVNVYLDGEYAISLSRIVAAWLDVGQTLTEEKIARLTAEDQIESAYQKAIRFISYRPRTSLEIRKKLASQAVPEEVIASVVEKLIQNYHLDDKKFAELWVENRLANRPRSRRILSYELRNKGVHEDVINEVLEGAEEEAAIAMKAGIKYLPKIHQMDWQQFKNKVGTYLAGKGFSYSIVLDVLPVLWQKYSNPANENNYG